MSKLFSLTDFQRYLDRKEILYVCPCCQKKDVTYSAVGLPIRANVEDEVTGKIKQSDDVNDNVGLGFVETEVTQEGKVTDIRFNAFPTFLIRCNHCGFMGLFDAKFVQKECLK